MKLKGAFVRDGRTRVAERQPGGHDVLMGAGGEVPKAKEPAANALITPTRAGMVAKRAAVHPGGDRLLRGEIPGLRLRLAIEAIVVYVRHIEDIIT